MKTYTRATVIGHIGSEVVMRRTANGKPVVNLSVATNERRKDGLEVTTWHRAVLWDRLAEFANERLSKGAPIYLEGRLRSNDWVDQQGIKRSRTEIVAFELIQLQRAVSTEEAGVPVVSRPSHSVGASSFRREPEPTMVHPGIRRQDGAEIAEVVEEIPF